MRGGLFPVRRRALWSARLPALAMVVAALWLAFLPGRIAAEESPSATVMGMFWVGWTLALAVALTLAWGQWRKVPAGAQGGWLRMGPDGVEYAVGPDRHLVPWDRVGAIHPIRRGPAGAPVAVWLSADASAGLTHAREHVLAAAVQRSPYRPVARADGLILPIRLFGADRADAVMAALTQSHAGAQMARQGG